MYFLNEIRMPVISSETNKQFYVEIYYFTFALIVHKLYLNVDKFDSIPQ